MNEQVVVRVLRRTREAEGVTTLRFDLDRECRPGQFVMVWIPGIDEIPMSISHIDGSKGMTVKSVGEATEALSNMKEGDILGIRGPYGNGYDIGEGRTLFVGGGTGMASLLPAIETRAGNNDVAIGARTAKEILFEERAMKSARRLMVSTDDGTKGFHGNAVQLARDMMSRESYEMVIGCGPEKMLYHLFMLCQEMKVPCQMSLERYMKCGAGLCGSCAIDGRRVCQEGPVFSSDQLLLLGEFGRKKRDECGCSIPL